MPLPAVLQNLPLPIFGAPLFIVSNPRHVIEQCKAGIVGAALSVALALPMPAHAAGVPKAHKR